MQNPLKKPSWSPYKVGAGIGILSWITFLFMFKSLSLTTAFVRCAGFIVGIFSTEHISETPYFSKYVEYKPVFEWQCALLVGLLIGAWIASRATAPVEPQTPALWTQNFGLKRKTRIIGAILGGFLLLFGARVAGGCTLGHAISGGLQLSTTSWLFLGTFFTTGIVVAHILYRKN